MEFSPTDVTDRHTDLNKEAVLNLTPLLVARVLGLMIVFLLLAYLTSIVYERVARPEETTLGYKLVRSFDMNYEENFPAFFSSAILLLASLLLFFISYLVKDDKRGVRKWGFLGFIFLFMAVDENLQLHEGVSEIVRPMLATDLSGLLYWAWVVPYGVLVVIGGAYFYNFILGLPSKTRTLFILSGTMYVAGALGLELFEGYFYVRYGFYHIYNLVLYTMEEVLEMSGVVLFIYALLDYLVLLKAQVLFSPDPGDSRIGRILSERKGDTARLPKV